MTQGATTVTALYDGFDPVQEQSPTGTVSANLQIGLGVDERFTRTKAGATSTYLTDLLGSTVALADSAGVVQTSYGYDPYGVTSQTGAANDNTYQFTGRQNDGTGLYYYRARYYNPSWGRFISEDPIGLAGGINQYAYVEANPIGYVDPTGLQGVPQGWPYPDCIPPLSDDKLRGKTPEQLQDMYKRLRAAKMNEEAKKVQQWQKYNDIRNSGKPRGGPVTRVPFLFWGDWQKYELCSTNPSLPWCQQTEKPKESCDPCRNGG